MKNVNTSKKWVRSIKMSSAKYIAPLIFFWFNQIYLLSCDGEGKIYCGSQGEKNEYVIAWTNI
jgi:hypothetical protein